MGYPWLRELARLGREGVGSLLTDVEEGVCSTPSKCVMVAGEWLVRKGRTPGKGRRRTDVEEEEC
jgi:hypothetical protein